MFTGIIQGIGRVAAIEARGGDSRLVIATGDADLGSIARGDSIAVSGVCLTATALDADHFAADASQETLSRSTLGELTVGARVNLETALRAGEPLGGHLVSGHVDGLAALAERVAEARSWRLTFAVPSDLARFFAPKGAVCVDGISLTVNEVEDDRFGVNIVPYTMEHTTLAESAVGEPVNLEIDVIMRYLARLEAAR
jgi:riboflavin synthase